MEVPTAPACTVVVFGAAGDLTKRLLMPSVYNLVAAKLIDPGTRFIGADHNDRDAAGWRSEIGDALHEFAAQKGAESHATIDDTVWSSLAERLDYVRFDFTDDAAYDGLAKRLGDGGNVIFYLAVSPRFFETIAAGLGRAGLLTEKGGFRRLIVEKPFGHDTASARDLNAKLLSLASEAQIYRIDHFLGKEAVQGIAALRFATRMFEPLFNRDAISHVQITAAETVGVEERGAFYESTGALRDMVPNHLFSLLTLIAMDAPASYAGDAVRDAKAALLSALQPVRATDAARGQYSAGTVDGRAVAAYRDEDGVAHDSRTETFAALRVLVGNERWRGVPFYLRTGKRLSAHVTTIAIMLRPPNGPLDASATSPHLLGFGIDPERGVVERFPAKAPGVELQLGGAAMTFRYETTFDEPPNVGYETLLYHAMTGENMLFQRADMIEREWTALEPLLDAWKSGDPEIYPAGGSGPAGAHELLTQDGNAWLDVGPLGALGG